MNYHWVPPRGTKAITAARAKVQFGASIRHMLVHRVDEVRSVWIDGALHIQASWVCGGGTGDAVLFAHADDGARLCQRCTIADDGPGVYRFFSKSGALLYIGSSVHVRSRLLQHSSSIRWPQVARVAIEWHADELSARRAEARAIVAELPRWNVSGKPRRTHEPAVSA